MKYIAIEKIKKEIKSLKEKLPDSHNLLTLEQLEFARGQQFEISEFEEFIDITEHESDIIYKNYEEACETDIMITEDYVSFETAKLLKEKGFDEKCDYLYVDGELLRAHGYACNWNDGETLFADYKNECSAPTIQTAMKWLRDNNGIAVIPTLSSILDNEKFLWDIKIVVAKNGESYSQGWIYESYEHACDVAIEYCLKSLI